MIVLVLALACATEADTGCDDAAPVTWNNFGHGFMTTYCVGCHSVENTDRRYGAPTGVDFDTEDDAIEWAARTRVRVLEDSDMPVGGGVYAADLELLDTWLRCELGE